MHWHDLVLFLANQSITLSWILQFSAALKSMRKQFSINDQTPFNTFCFKCSHSKRITEDRTATFPGFYRNPATESSRLVHCSSKINIDSRWDCTYLFQKDVLGSVPISPGWLNKAVSLQVVADPLTVVDIRCGKARLTHRLTQNPVRLLFVPLENV